MTGEVDNTINARNYGSSSSPCFNIKKSINNLMITNNRWLTIFLDCQPGIAITLTLEPINSDEKDR